MNEQYRHCREGLRFASEAHSKIEVDCIALEPTVRRNVEYFSTPETSAVRRRALLSDGRHDRSNPVAERQGKTLRSCILCGDPTFYVRSCNQSLVLCIVYRAD